MIRSLGPANQSTCGISRTGCCTRGLGLRGNSVGGFVLFIVHVHLSRPRVSAGLDFFSAAPHPLNQCVWADRTPVRGRYSPEKRPTETGKLFVEEANVIFLLALISPPAEFFQIPGKNREPAFD